MKVGGSYGSGINELRSRTPRIAVSGQDYFPEARGRQTFSDSARPRLSSAKFANGGWITGAKLRKRKEKNIM